MTEFDFIDGHKLKIERSGRKYPVTLVDPARKKPTPIRTLSRNFWFDWTANQKFVARLAEKIGCPPNNVVAPLEKIASRITLEGKKILEPQRLSGEIGQTTILREESLQERIEREVKKTLGEKPAGAGYFSTENDSYRVELFARRGLILTISKNFENEWFPEIEGKKISELFFYKHDEGLTEVLEGKFDQDDIPKFAAAYVQALCQAILRGAVKEVVGEFVEVDGIPLAVYFDVSKNPPEQINELTHVLRESQRVPWKLPGFPELKPDPELWNDVKLFAKGYLFIEGEDARDVYVAKVYWSYHIDLIYQFTPYFAYIGPYKSGKTRAQEVDEALCRRPLRVSHITEADIFRITELFRPTWIIDEQDLNVPGVLSLLNAGQRKGVLVPRINMDKQGREQVEWFSLYGLKILSGLQEFKRTLQSRCVPFRMENPCRKFPKEIDEKKAKNLRARLLAQSLLNRKKLRVIDEIREVRDGRIDELFTPLLAMAQTYNPEAAPAIVRYAQKTEGEERIEDQTGLEARVLQVLFDVWAERLRENSGRESEGKPAEWDEKSIPVSEITDKLNEGVPEKYHFSSSKVGRRLAALKIPKDKGTKGKRVVILDRDVLTRLARRYGVDAHDIVALEPPPTHPLSAIVPPSQKEGFSEPQNTKKAILGGVAGGTNSATSATPVGNSANGGKRFVGTGNNGAEAKPSLARPMIEELGEPEKPKETQGTPIKCPIYKASGRVHRAEPTPQDDEYVKSRLFKEFGMLPFKPSQVRRLFEDDATRERAWAVIEDMRGSGDMEILQLMGGGKAFQFAWSYKPAQKPPNLDQTERVRRVYEIIALVEEQYEGGAPVREVRREAEVDGISQAALDEAIDWGKKEGILYEPRAGSIARAVKSEPPRGSASSVSSKAPTTQDLEKSICSYPRKTLISEDKMVEELNVPLERLRVVLGSLALRGMIIPHGGRMWEMI